MAEMMHSECPQALWLEHVAPLLMASAAAQPYTYFSVGANKGFEVASMYQRVANASFDNLDWLNALGNYAKRTAHAPVYRGCGAVCNACGERPKHVSPPGRLEVHAFEMAKANANWLRTAFERFGIASTARVVEAVVSNATGFMGVENRSAVVGFERFVATSLKVAAIYTAMHPGHTFGHVPVTTIDTYIAEAQLERVHHVAIDAEGFDALVIEGMRDALASGKVDILEFEYGGIAHWNPTNPERRTLDGTLGLLDSAGLDCFLQSNGGCLVPVSGACWKPALAATHAWSNFVCARRAHKGGPAAALWRHAAHHPPPDASRPNASHACQYAASPSHPVPKWAVIAAGRR